ncbi:MAG: AAA family ATPase, partial [Myxococcota bacterium]
MLQRMTVTGLGPHRDFTAQLDPSGRTVIAGPSESGKTFLLEAITFCLWGRAHGGKLQPEAISDGMNKATVEILLDSGRLLRRSVTATTQRRSITIGEDTQTYTTESAFAEGLGDLGRDVDVLHLVIAPFQWVEMVQGNARPFRDLLTRILPEMDVAAEVKTLVEAQGFVLEDGEAELGEKEVMGLRSKARKDRDEALGRQQASQERMATLATMEPAAPPGGSDEDRTALLEAAAAWADHDRQSGGGDKHAVAAEAARVWDQRIAALGAEPAWDPAFDGAEGRFQRAQLAANQATQVYQQAYGQHQTALTQMQQFQGMDPSVCPTCQRPGWATGVQYLQQLQTFQNQLKLSFDQATANFQAAKAELDAATATAAGAREAELRRKGWADTKRSLGARPV